MATTLNHSQQEILLFLQRPHTYPPTVREIGAAVGLRSSSTVQNHLNALEAKGLIRRDPTKSRTVEVVGAPSAIRLASLQIPLVGRVAAGTPVLAEQNIEDHLALGSEIAGGDDAFALRVQGDSMINAGIHDGDIVIVRPNPAPNNGEIVVARIENAQTGEHEVTVKRFFREANRVRLQPENSAMQTIFVDSVVIEGTVKAVIRLLTR